MRRSSEAESRGRVPTCGLIFVSMNHSCCRLFPLAKAQRSQRRKHTSKTMKTNLIAGDGQCDRDLHMYVCTHACTHSYMNYYSCTYTIIHGHSLTHTPSFLMIEY